jgi:hypothetical protein
VAAGVRGEMVLTPDAEYLMSESGYVFHLKDASPPKK